MNRAALCSALSGLLDVDIAAIKSSTLLKAYATFKSMKKIGAQSVAEKYKHICDSYKGTYAHGLLKMEFSILAKIGDDLYNLFSTFSDAGFIHFVVPDLVCDVDEFMDKFLRLYGADRPIEMAHTIIQIRRILYKNANVDTMFNSDETRGHDAKIKELYAAYETIEGNATIRLSIERFIIFYKSICFYSLDIGHMMPAAIGYKTKDLHKVMNLLSNDLQLSRNDQINMLHYIFVDRLQAEDIQNKLPVYDFAVEKDKKIRRKLLIEAQRLMVKIPPLDLLCAITIYKRSGTTNRRTLSDYSYINNDVTLENGLICALFTSALEIDDSNENVAVFAPSPFFVLKWLRSNTLSSIKVTFIFENEAQCDVVRFYYYEGTYTQEPNTCISFTSMAEWMQSLKRMEGMGIGFTKALVFLCTSETRKDIGQSVWYQMIKQYSKKQIELFALMPSYEFETARSPFSPELEDGRIMIRSVVIVPQGINNSTKPRRKILVHSVFCPEGVDAKNKNKISIYAYTLNLDMGTQALSRMECQPVMVEQNDFANLDCSIRDMYRQEIYKRASSGKKRRAAIPYDFTPELTIWYSISYPPNNSGRPRVEAYFCEPPEQQKGFRGAKEFGNMIETTKKHTTKVPLDTIAAWLENVYPFAEVQQRHKKKELLIAGEDSLPKERVNIQNEVIQRFSQSFSKGNIAIKTFWYMRPDIQELLAASDYALLVETVKTEIGLIRIKEIQSEYCEEQLLQCFPDDTQEILRRRFKILSLLIDEAVRSGDCEQNPLSKTIKNRRSNDRLFAQVRHALVKKHFTLGEMERAYAAICAKIEAGQLEYFGVMIRLLTGLENNIICALKWKDIHTIKDYHIDKIMITRQVTNDGNKYSGFASLEDYRCFPCSTLLSELFSKQREKIEALVPKLTDINELPIVNPAAAFKNGKERYRAYPPRNLEMCSKKILNVVGIDDRVVDVATTDKGTKETNLNQYGGDFFRENFKHWGQALGCFNTDELMYLIGNKPDTTFGRYYCDFLNDASQLMMAIKLQRISAMLCGRIEPPKQVNVHAGENKFVSCGKNPVRVVIKLSLPGGKAHMHIQSKNGVAVYAALLKVQE